MTGKKGEIVNLRQVRKRRAREEARARGDANAVQFGRTGTEKKATKAEQARAARALDAHCRTPEGGREPDRKDDGSSA